MQFFTQLLLDLPPKLLNIETIKIYKDFCHELNQTLLKGEICKLGDPYSKLTEIFQEILQKLAPLKSKQVRGNYAPFMNIELSKVILSKSRLRNKYLKWPSPEHFLFSNLTH